MEPAVSNYHQAERVREGLQEAHQLEQSFNQISQFKHQQKDNGDFLCLKRVQTVSVYNTRKMVFGKLGMSFYQNSFTQSCSRGSTPRRQFQPRPSNSLVLLDLDSEDRVPSYRHQLPFGRRVGLSFPCFLQLRAVKM